MSTVDTSLPEASPVDGHRRSSHAMAPAAAWCAAAAAAAHVAVVPEHLTEWPAAGVVFLAVAIGQAALAAALYITGLGPRLLALAAWANTCVVVLYVISRTAGMPFAPESHAHREGSGGSFASAFGAIGGAEVVALVAELALIALLVAMLPPLLSRRASTLLMLTGAGLWMSSALGLLG